MYRVTVEFPECEGAVELFKMLRDEDYNPTISKEGFGQCTVIEVNSGVASLHSSPTNGEGVIVVDYDEDKQ